MAARGAPRLRGPRVRLLPSRLVPPPPHPTSPLPSFKTKSSPPPLDALYTRRHARVESARGGYVLIADTVYLPPPRQRGLLLARHGRPNLSKTIAWQLRGRPPSPSSSLKGDSRGSSFRSVGGQRFGSVRSSVMSPDEGEEDTWSFCSQDNLVSSGADLKVYFFSII